METVVRSVVWARKGSSVPSVSSQHRCQLASGLLPLLQTSGSQRLAPSAEPRVESERVAGSGHLCSVSATIRAPRSFRLHSMRMSKGRLEDEVGAILDGSRAALRVSRARCYAMGPSGDYRLAASFGFVSRFGPEDFLEASHPLVDWVQRHRKPAYANFPRGAGRLGAAMEQDQYARMLGVPVYVGSRLVGILELQDKLEGVFGAEDLRSAGKVGTQIAAVLEVFDGAPVAGAEPT